jgi:hypothetical protein
MLSKIDLRQWCLPLVLNRPTKNILARYLTDLRSTRLTTSILTQLPLEALAMVTNHT